MDLFAWADSRPAAAPPETALAPEEQVSAKPETAVIIDKRAFFRQRKRFFLSLYYRDENALVRPVTGEVLYPPKFKKKPTPDEQESDNAAREIA
ncbi:hypothetical protein ASC71_20075 [Rhizobium sp. Root1240]|nr:hypothetical protein ASC71_20075 [Rhizobium sp. Root1240]